MKCENYRDMISLYIDDKLDKNGKEIVEEHLKTCEHCKKELDELIEIRNILLEAPVAELPEGFKESLHEKLLKTSKEDEKSIKIENSEEITNINKVKKRKRFNWKTLSAVAALILLMVASGAVLSNIGLGGLQQKSKLAKEEARDFGVMEEKAAAPEMDQALRFDDAAENGQAPSAGPRTQENRMFTTEQAQPAEGNDGREVQIETGRKIILNGYLQLDVEEYDVIQDRIVSMVVSRGGFVQNSNTRYKYFNRSQLEESLKEGNITLRIPEGEFYNIYNDIKSFGTVIDSRINTSDITGQYRDTVNEVENLKIQEGRLRDIMEKAANVQEILEVERELSRVRGDINRLTGNIKNWDNLVSLSTIEVFLNEVKLGDAQIKPLNDSIWAQSKKGFVRTTNGLINLIERLVIKAISILPILIILSIVTILSYSLYRKIRFKKVKH